MLRFLLCLVLTNFSVNALEENLASAPARSCPTWYYRIGDGGNCECGDLVGRVIRCETDWRIRLLLKHCMTHDATNNITSVGSCPYSTSQGKLDESFVLQPRVLQDLTHFTCAPTKRVGPLCSHCFNSTYGVSILSYSYECAPCKGYVIGWLLYIGMQFVPLTVLVFVVMAFKIQATSPHLNVVLYISQTILYTINSSPHSFFSTAEHSYWLMFLTTVLGVSHLDFFRYIHPPFCISKNYSVFQVLSIEYVGPFYPLLVIGLVYFCCIVISSSKRLRLAVSKTTIAKWWISRNRRFSVAGLKSRITDAFATFIVFGYSKVQFASYALLSQTKLFTSMDGDTNISESSFTLYNASIPYLSQQHTPYFCLAVLVLALQVLFGLFLVVNNVKVFKRAAGYFPLCRYLEFPRSLANSFQCCYKNGVNGTSWDCRCFSGVFLLLRTIVWFPGIFNSLYTYMMLVTVPMVMSLLIGTVFPYKNDKLNRLECTWLTFLVIGQYTMINGIFVSDYSIHPYVTLCIMLTVVLAYFVAVVVRRSILLFSHGNTDRLQNWRSHVNFKTMRNKICRKKHPNAEYDSDDLADRLENPSKYLQPLISPGASVNKYEGIVPVDASNY